MKKIIFVLFLIPALAGTLAGTRASTCASALEPDFGVLLNQYAGYGNYEVRGGAFEYNAAVIPRFSLLIGDKSDFFISAMMTAGIDGEKNYFVPELMRTEFSMQSGNWELSIGRFNYADPLGFIVNGLFDGVQVTHSTSAGRLGIGAWYTGFLYKKTADIIISKAEKDSYSADLDYENFFDTYFAPKRVFAAIDWEHPPIGNYLRLSLSLIGQMDLSEETGKIHSEYFALKAGLPFYNAFLNAGGSFSAVQIEAHDGNYYFNTGFAIDAGLSWILPTVYNSKISANLNFTSGKLGQYIGAFTPITAEYPGEIFRAQMTALGEIEVNYSARFNDKLGLSVNASYFIRPDFVTPNSFPYASDGNTGYFLGPEIFANIIWSVVPDVQIKAGGGAFVPALGTVWPAEAVLWKAGISAVMAVY